MKVRKRPIVVDAWPIVELLADAKVGIDVLPEEVRKAYVECIIEFEVDRITIATMEGIMSGPEGWFLIRGIEGEWYPCDGAIFESSYERVQNIEGRWHPIDPVVG